MSSDKTKRLGLNKWVGSDQVLRAEFNENFDKIDAYVDDSLAVKTTSMQLKQGLQVIDVNQSSPLNNVSIQGRTLVNLLGRDGNCEDLTIWGTFQVSQALDSNNKSIGNNAIKLTMSTGFTSGSTSTITTRTFSFKAGKYYVAVADIKNGTATNGNFYINGTTAAKGQHIITATDKFYPAWRAYNPDAAVSGLTMVLGINGAAGQYAYFDGVRIYEITQAEYNALDSMTPEEIAAKWPYVDDMKSVYSPYVTKYGENLLPPFNEWTAYGGSPIVTDHYKVNVSINDKVVYFASVVAGQAYSVSANFSDVNGRINIGFAADSSSAAISQYDYYGSGLVKGENLVAPAGANVIVVRLLSIASSLMTTASNPMLNLGTTSKPFKPRNDDQLFFPNVQLASNLDGTVYDTLFQRDGKYWKQARFKTMDLTGDLSWVRHASFPGYKLTRLSIAPPIKDTGTVIKYDGSLLRYIQQGVSFSAGDQQVVLDSTDLAPNTTIIAISNADSGWGDKYEPLDEEVRAYFNGWKMNNGTFGQAYNNTGTRTWTAWYAQDNNQAPTIIPTSIALAPNGARYTPYRLQYQLAATTVEEIASEGGITLHEGANQVEIGTGMIVRENVRPFVFGGKAHINNSTPSGASNILRKRVGKITRVHKDSLIDGWTISQLPTNNPSYPILGAEVAWNSEANFVNSAAYTVTYLALDQHAISCNVQSIKFEHAGNMKSAVDTLAVGYADMAARVGALEITRAQRVQPQWIRPTLLNGWTNFGPSDASAGYCLDEFSIVRLQGLIKPGVTAQSTVILQLPASCRPSHLRRFTVPALGDGVFSFADLFVNSLGELRIDAVPKGVAWVSLDTITFSLF
ncbi:hypothetical protein ACFCP7_10135 [Paenibacillus elgii]